MARDRPDIGDIFVSWVGNIGNGRVSGGKVERFHHTGVKYCFRDSDSKLLGFCNCGRKNGRLCFSHKETATSNN